MQGANETEQPNQKKGKDENRLLVERMCRGQTHTRKDGHHYPWEKRRLKSRWSIAAHLLEAQIKNSDGAKGRCGDPGSLTPGWWDVRRCSRSGREEGSFLWNGIRVCYLTQQWHSCLGIYPGEMKTVFTQKPVRGRSQQLYSNSPKLETLKGQMLKTKTLWERGGHPFHGILLINKTRTSCQYTQRLGEISRELQSVKKANHKRLHDST